MTAAAGADRRRGSWRRPRIGRSLGARFVALFLVLAFAVTVTFVSGMQAALRFGWADYARPLVAEYADMLAARIGTPPDLAEAQALTQRLPLRIRIEGPVINWSSEPDEPDEPHTVRRGPRRGEGSLWHPSRTLADGHRISFGLAHIAREDGPDERPRRVGWVTLAVLLLLTALAYAVVRHWLRPLRQIRAGAVRYAEGDFSQPIAEVTRDELGELAAQINRMAASLHGMLDAKRQLLLAISHELRSPLTRARLNAELVGEGRARDALLHDLAEMRDLITDLLESERLSGGHAALNLEPTDLNALVAEVLTTHFSGRPVTTELADGLMPLRLDPTRIKLLLRNLLDNALRHSADSDPPPRLTTSNVAGGVRLTLRDHGPGVAEDQLPRLAEAFYRADSARQRSTGGVGLGLYLCRLVAAAHGGQLTLRNARPGLEVEVVLPPLIEG